MNLLLYQTLFLVIDQDKDGKILLLQLVKLIRALSRDMEQNFKVS